jgi:class 3 adenylate cyclase/tetratricopeptide (TPR) repeat protein
MIGCPDCGQENPAGARFCNSCGRPLGDAVVPLREVRKTVSVVFCDVVGSTELGERHDPEVLRGMMERFYAAVRAPVERYGGTVEKVIGDALVAVFGIPVVHEDDALRAVRAAVEMRDAVGKAGELSARIGVNTGDVLARDPTEGESLVVGDAVNVAARLEQLAAPGEVLVGDATWALIGHAASGDRLAPMAAKGKRQPLVAWRLRSVDPQAPGHKRRLDLPMVGREAELQLLRWALERTEQTARPHLVTVLGQPGIGKSRLVAEIPRLRDGLTVLSGQCRATAAASSLEPLLEVIRAATGNGRRPPPLAAGDADAVAAVVERPGAVGAPDVAWAASRLLGAMAGEETVVVVLEDVHWADDMLLDVVDQLLGQGRGRALMVVCTARPELADRRPSWGVGTNMLSVALERLDDGQTLSLLRHAGPSLRLDQAERVARVAEGNPLFAEHLAALVEDAQDTEALPPSIGLLLTARLEALPEPEREVLGVAAVAGRDFPAVAVAALVRRPVDADLDHVGRRELVEPIGGEEGRYRFAHALLQEAAYGLLPKARRADLHVALARWLDDHGAGDAVVGDHLDRAWRLRAELGVADPVLAEEAGLRLTEAGRRADAMGEPPARARALLERALDLLPDGSPGQAAATIELAAAGWNILPAEDVLRLLEDGIRRASALGMRALELRGRILHLRSSLVYDLVDVNERSAQITAAISELELLDDRRALATALCALGAIEIGLGRAANALVSAQRAVQILREIDQDTVWAVELLVEAAVTSPLPMPEALLGELMDEFGHRPTARVELLGGQAMLAALRGDFRDAHQLQDEATQIERDLGRRTAYETTSLEGELLLQERRFDEARVAWGESVDELTNAGFQRAAVGWKCTLALAEARSGRPTVARDRARKLVDDPAAGYHGVTQANLALCEAALADGNPGPAVGFARRALEVASGGDWVLLIVDARRTLARALRAAGAAAGAEREEQLAAAAAEAKGLSAAAYTPRSEPHEEAHDR